MTRSIIRAAEWTLGPDTEPGASGPVYEAECTTCGDASEAGHEQSTPEIWALKHTGSHPSHRSFRAITTSFWRVTPAPGNPFCEADRCQT